MTWSNLSTLLFIIFLQNWIGALKNFSKSLAEIQSFDIERDAHIADIVNESIHMDTIAFKSISNVTHQVISGFNPYRDGYDPKLICIVLNQLATSRIISLFQPHRDSYDSENLTHGYAKNHCLLSSFCHAFVPYRDSYDQNQSWTMDSPDHPSGSSPHSRFAISSYLKYLSYQYSYDRGKKAEYLVESDGKQYRRKGMMTPAVNFSEDYCRSNVFGSITIQHWQWSIISTLHTIISWSWQCPKHGRVLYGDIPVL